MKDLLASYKSFDNFIKMQLLVVFVISLSWSLIVPIITKLQGLLWSTSIISAYLILNRISVFLTPYFKKLTIIKAYKILIILDVLYIVTIFLYFYSPLLFLYTEATLMTMYGIIMTVFGISYNAFLMEKYNSDVFKNVQYLERISMAAAGIIGYTIVILIDVISRNMDIAIITFIIILSINLLFQIYNYIYFWKNLKIEEN